MISRYDLPPKRESLAMTQLAAMADFSLDPEKLPKKLELDLSPAVEDYLLKLAAVSGRSVDELILEILDKALQDKGNGG